MSGKPGQRSQSEIALHIEVAGYLDVWLDPRVWWSTFPAGGGGFHRGQQLKSMGLKPGVPDILLLWGRMFGIELKTEDGDLSDVQIRVHSHMVAAGAWVATCRSLDHVKLILNQWQIPIVAQKSSVSSFAVAVERAVSAIGHNSQGTDHEWPRDDYFENLLARDKLKR